MKPFFLVLAIVLMSVVGSLNRPLIGASLTDTNAISSFSNSDSGAKAKIDAAAVAAFGLGMAHGAVLGFVAHAVYDIFAGFGHPDSLNSPNGKQPTSMRSLDN